MEMEYLNPIGLGAFGYMAGHISGVNPQASAFTFALAATAGLVFKKCVLDQYRYSADKNYPPLKNIGAFLSLSVAYRIAKVIFRDFSLKEFGKVLLPAACIFQISSGIVPMPR